MRALPVIPTDNSSDDRSLNVEGSRAKQRASFLTFTCIEKWATKSEALAVGMAAFYPLSVWRQQLPTVFLLSEESQNFLIWDIFQLKFTFVLGSF